MSTYRKYWDGLIVVLAALLMLYWLSGQVSFLSTALPLDNSWESRLIFRTSNTIEFLCYCMVLASCGCYFLNKVWSLYILELYGLWWLVARLLDWLTPMWEFSQLLLLHKVNLFYLVLVLYGFALVNTARHKLTVLGGRL